MKRVAPWMGVVLVACISTQAHAKLVEYIFTGVVAAGGVDNGGVFTGIPNSSLAGLTYTAVFQVDTSAGEDDSGVNTIQMIGGSNYGVASTPIVNCTITINKHKEVIGPGTYGGIISSEEPGGIVAMSYGAVGRQVMYGGVDSPNLPYSLSTNVAAYTVQSTDSLPDDYFSVYTGGAMDLSQSVLAQGTLLPQTVSIKTVVGFQPLANALVDGIEGANGWYITPASVTWVVTGDPAPSETGCTPTTLSDTKSERLTCALANTHGSYTTTVTIKQDTVPPLITITRPAQGKVYKVGATVEALFSCADATSGIESCIGEEGAKGTPIYTAVAGTYGFTVAATDKAGNQSTATVTYTVK